MHAVAWVALMMVCAQPPSRAHKKTPAQTPEASSEETAQTIRLTRADASFFAADVRLPRPPARPLFARLSEGQAPKGTSFLPFVEVASTEGASARVMVAIAAARTGVVSGEARVTIDLFEIGSGTPPRAPLGRRSIDLVVELAPDGLLASTDAVERDRRTFHEAQEAASAAYEKLHALQDYLHLDKLEFPPPIERITEKDLAETVAFFRNRTRAEIARGHLRALADASDPAVAEAAVLAIGGLTKKPTGAAAKASAMEGQRIGRVFEMAEEALDDLRIDESEGYLNKLKSGGKLEKKELARALLLLGGIYAVRGRPSDAGRSIGSALCLDPEVALPASFRRDPMPKAFALAKKDPARCQRPMAIDRPAAARTSANTVHLRASFGPDPYGLAGGADVEIWGSGGALAKSEHVRIPEDGPRDIVADLSESKEIENYAGQLLIKIYLRDVSGVVLASLGDPDPLAVSLGEGPGGPLELPWWIWVVAGGVVAAGALTAGVIAASGHQTKQGIGPISAEF